jgi:hypothetical protein
LPAARDVINCDNDGGGGGGEEDENDDKLQTIRDRFHVHFCQSVISPKPYVLCHTVLAALS